GELINGETVAELLKRWANILPEGEYDAGLKPIAGDASPTVAFAPALIMRRRSRAGLLRLLDQIARDIAEKQDVPPGVRFLIDVVDDRGHRQGDGDEPRSTCFLCPPTTSSGRSSTGSRPERTSSF